MIIFRWWNFEDFKISSSCSSTLFEFFVISMYYFYKNKLLFLKKRGRQCFWISSNIWGSLALVTFPHAIYSIAEAFKVIQYPWWSHPGLLFPELISKVLNLGELEWQKFFTKKL